MRGVEFDEDNYRRIDLQDKRLPMDCLKVPDRVVVKILDTTNALLFEEMNRLDKVVDESKGLDELDGIDWWNRKTRMNEINGKYTMDEMDKMNWWD